MMTWLAFAVGAAWSLAARRLAAEAALALRMWRRWRRSVYRAQVEDAERALFTAVVLAILTTAMTGGAAALVLLLEMSFK